MGSRAMNGPPGRFGGACGAALIAVSTCAIAAPHLRAKRSVLSASEIPQAQIDDCVVALAATRWPTKELVADRSQGVQLATMQALARYWSTEYDWRKAEARLNALPQFTTEIDGVKIHFIHVKSKHANALPLIMTHGWPGSVIELLETIGPLTDPTAHGGTRRGRIRPGAAVAAGLRFFGRAAQSSAGIPAASRSRGQS